MQVRSIRATSGLPRPCRMEHHRWLAVESPLAYDELGPPPEPIGTIR